MRECVHRHPTRWSPRVRVFCGKAFTTHDNPLLLHGAACMCVGAKSPAAKRHPDGPREPMFRSLVARFQTRCQRYTKQTKKGGLRGRGARRLGRWSGSVCQWLFGERCKSRRRAGNARARRAIAHTGNFPDKAVRFPATRCGGRGASRQRHRTRRDADGHRQVCENPRPC